MAAFPLLRDHEPDRAEAALIYLVEREYGAAVNRFFGPEVPQHVFDGTVSPVFNIGRGAQGR